MNLLFGGRGDAARDWGRREAREGVSNESWVRESGRAKNGLNGEGGRQTDGRIDRQDQWTAKKADRR